MTVYLLDALQHLQNKGLIFPLREDAFQLSYKFPANITESEWNAYVWNPNNEAGTSPKPTFQELIAARNDFILDAFRQRGYEQLYTHCRKIICETYNGKDITHEIQKRRTIRDSASLNVIADGKTKDDSKLALQIRYHQIKEYINTETDVNRLNLFQPTDNETNWNMAADWTRPDGKEVALATADVTTFTLTRFDIFQEERFRIETVVPPHEYQAYNAAIISNIFVYGLDTASWPDPAQKQKTRWDSFRNRILEIQKRCRDLIEYTIIPADYKDDKYWGATAYVPPAPILAVTFGAETIANQTYAVGTAIANLIAPVATGGRGPLAYTLTPLIAGLVFNPTTRTLSGTPTVAVTETIVYKAMDADGRMACINFNIVVN